MYCYSCKGLAKADEVTYGHVFSIEQVECGLALSVLLLTTSKQKSQLSKCCGLTRHSQVSPQQLLTTVRMHTHRR